MFESLFSKSKNTSDGNETAENKIEPNYTHELCVVFIDDQQLSMRIKDNKTEAYDAILKWLDTDSKYFMFRDASSGDSTIIIKDKIIFVKLYKLDV